MGGRYMEVFEAMRRRRSVRHFDPTRDVPQEMLEEMLRCACLAPSAGNVQPWRFVVVKEEGKKKALAAAALGQDFVARAPVVIVVCADLSAHAASYGRRGVETYALQDTAAAVQNMLLAATALGLGACWVGAFNEAEAAGILGLPRGRRPVALIPVGYPARESSRPPKKDFREVTEYI